jgi:hypothetical protein
MEMSGSWTSDPVILKNENHISKVQKNLGITSDISHKTVQIQFKIIVFGATKK